MQALRAAFAALVAAEIFAHRRHDETFLLSCVRRPSRLHDYRLQAIHILAKRLGVPLDDPFLRRIASA